jgi:hypothetical protein
VPEDDEVENIRLRGDRFVRHIDGACPQPLIAQLPGQRPKAITVAIECAYSPAVGLKSFEPSRSIPLPAPAIKTDFTPRPHP